MKERPILFSGPRVRAILDGRKTQTRRVVKPQPSEVDGQLRTEGAAMIAAIFGRLPTKEDEDAMKPVCPFGVPGDRLWVRETAIYWTYADGRVGGAEPVVYQDDEEWDGILRESKSTPPYEVDNDHGWWKLRPSIHMPRWASRITLEVVSVRVERLADISDADAKAEGYASASEFLGAPWAVSVGPNPWVWVVEFKRVEVAK